MTARSPRALLAATAAVLTACQGEHAPPADTAASAPVPAAAAPPTTPTPASAAAPTATAASAAGGRPTVDAKNVAASIQYDSAAKTAKIPVISGLTSNGGGWNFNGYAQGQMTIVVPVGTKVVMPYYNDDIVPHSMVAVAGSASRIPSAPGDPVFRGATTRSPDNGLMTGQHDDVTFTAETPGRFLLVCGVPGHAQSGMWVYLEVSRTAKRPTVRTS
jgi:sulfocyanin